MSVESRRIASLRVRLVTAEVPRTDAVERAVERVWQDEKAKRGDHLFNGEVLSVVRIRMEDELVEVRLSDYRTFLAQLREPGLYEALQLRPLAVSGLVVSGTRIALGRRAAHLTQDPGRWELVPSGGVAPDALRAGGEAGAAEEQLYVELEEELGLPRSAVASVTPFVLVEDRAAHVVDVGLEVTLGISQEEADRAAAARSDEYREVRWIGVDDVRTFDPVDVSLALLDAWTDLRRA